MKAPLRVAFGWVLYVAIFAAINPITVLLFDVVVDQPLSLTIHAALIAIAIFIFFHVAFLDRFWLWCDNGSSRQAKAKVEQ